MTIEISFGSAAFIVGACALLQWLFAEWIKARVLKSIEHEYQKRLEDYRYDLKVREQAAKVAEYLSLRNSDRNDVFLMNKMSWELALWLPAEIYQEIAHVVTGQPDAKKYKEVLIKVRRLLLKNQDDKLTWDNIIHTNWPAAEQGAAANP